MEAILITGLDIVRNPHQSPHGHIILAHFSADVGVFSFKGCVLVRTSKGGIAAWLPKLEDGRGAKLKGVSLNDEPTRNGLMAAAREMYIRMGGAEAEWRPYENGEPPRAAPDTQENERAGVSRFIGLGEARTEQIN